MIENVDNSVEIFGLRFPVRSRMEVIEDMLEKLKSGKGAGICFPDMSTMNLVVRDENLRNCLREHFELYNDGAALSWAAQKKGKPFRDNLNGTDLVPELLRQVPAGTKVYVVGGKNHTVNAAVENMQSIFSHVKFVGWHHGYLDCVTEEEVVKTMQQCSPDIVLVAMGNPLQINFIARHRAKEGLDHALFFGVGGLLHYFSGELRRAPLWVRRLKLEWLFITIQQPYKFKRYFCGIPCFFWNYFRIENYKPVRD